MSKAKTKKLKVKRRQTRREEVLEYLYSKPDGRPASYLDVAKQFQLSVMASSVKLFRLKKQGLIEPSSGSKIRPFFYMLTKAGLARLKATR